MASSVEIAKFQDYSNQYGETKKDGLRPLNDNSVSNGRKKSDQQTVRELCEQRGSPSG